MSVAESLDDFIKKNGNDVFIEAEGKPSRLIKFYEDYNSRFSPIVNNNSNGIIVLGENANKWGLELRLYLHDKPDFMDSTNNTVYRSEYSYRINDAQVIMELFELGYRIGLN